MAKQTAKLTISKSPKPQIASTPPVSAPAAKPDTGSKRNSSLGSSLASVTVQKRQRMIEEAAYYIAEQRGFGDGHDVEDWLLAEKQIDTTLSA